MASKQEVQVWKSAYLMIDLNKAFAFTDPGTVRRVISILNTDRKYRAAHGGDLFFLTAPIAVLIAYRCWVGSPSGTSSSGGETQRQRSRNLSIRMLGKQTSPQSKQTLGDSLSDDVKNAATHPCRHNAPTGPYHG